MASDTLLDRNAASTSSLRERVRVFCAEAVTAGAYEPSCNAWIQSFDPSFSRSLGAKGWLGMTWPREYGGTAASPYDRFAVLEELLVAGAPVAAHWMAERQTGPLLLRYGTEAQRVRYLPEIAAGRLYVSIGLSEPGSGSDLASVSTRATLLDGTWHLHGHKIWISHAHRTHLLVVMARTSREPRQHDGLTQFIVPTDAPGLTIVPIPAITGEAGFCEVFFDDVVVGMDAVVGEVGKAWGQVNSELASERSGPDRYLSAFPLLAAFLDETSAPPAATSRELGTVVATLWSLHALAENLQADSPVGSPRTTEIAVLKDQGTSFEQGMVETLRRELGPRQLEPGTPLRRMLEAAVLASPSFTLRGGTNEILRTVIAKAMVTG